MGFEWLMALWPCISRIICTMSVLTFLNANSLRALAHTPAKPESGPTPVPDAM